MQLLRNKITKLKQNTVYLPKSIPTPTPPPLYQPRRRFKLAGMGFFFIPTINGVLILSGKSHPYFLKSPTKGVLRSKGYKTRFLVVRMPVVLHKTQHHHSSWQKKLKPSYYRRKGVGFFNDLYRYKKGKKKFV